MSGRLIVKICRDLSPPTAKIRPGISSCSSNLAPRVPFGVPVRFRAFASRRPPRQVSGLAAVG